MAKSKTANYTPEGYNWPLVFEEANRHAPCSVPPAYPFTLAQFFNNTALILPPEAWAGANFTPRRLREIHTETEEGNWRTKAASKSQCEWGY